MKKVNDLTGAHLDYWVARAQAHHNVELKLKGVYENSTVYVDHVDVARVGLYEPSADWKTGGPIIEIEQIDLECGSGIWRASKGALCETGKTPLIAAMRCYVASVYGGGVDE